MCKPRYVYKYGSAERVLQIVKQLTVYLAPVSQLNDLYEFRLQSLYTEDDESPYRLFAKRLVHEGWANSLEEARKILAYGALEPEVRLMYSAYIAQLKDWLPRLMKHSGATCFSEHRNNQRMWATYGANHAGALIEFSTSTKDSSFGEHLTPVTYSETRIAVCPSDFMSDTLAFNSRVLNALCCVKHSHWRDEGEWRLTLLADSEQTTQMRLHAFERSAITRIVLGPRISEENETAIRKAAEGHDPPIPVYKRIIDEDHAREELMGFEQIHSLEQFLRWVDPQDAPVCSEECPDAASAGLTSALLPRSGGLASG